MNPLKTILITALSIISLHSVAQDLIPYRYGELWGYCTPSKKVVIPPQFEKAELFSEGLAAVGIGCDADCYDVYDGKWGYINSKGEFVIAPQYSMVTPFKNKKAFVSNYPEWMEINEQNETLRVFDENPRNDQPITQTDKHRKYYRLVIKRTSDSIIVQGTNLDSLTVIADSIIEVSREKGLLNKYINSEFLVNIQNQKGKLLFSQFYDQVEIISDKLFKVYSFYEGTYGYISDKELKYWDDGKEAPLLFPLHSLSQNNVGGIELNVRDMEFNRCYNSQYIDFRKPSVIVLKKTNQNYEAIKMYPLNGVKPVEMYDSISDDNWLFFPLNQNEELYQYWLKSLQNNEYKVMLTAFIPLPDEKLENELYFRLFQKGIRFTSTTENYNLLNYSYGIYEFSKPWTKNEIMSELIEDINMVGQAMIEQEDGQNVMLTGDQNPYAGRMLFDVMTLVTEDDVMEFLKYVDARPAIYMGEPYKISEVFATWLASGAPMVVD